MEYVIIYLIAAMATAISSIYELIWPLIVKAKQNNVDNEFTRYPVLSVFVVFVVNTIIAPYWMVILLIPSAHIAATIGMSATILQDSKIDS